MWQVCSTAEIPERGRLAYWVDAVCCALIHLDCQPRRDRPFFGEISIDPVGAARVGTVRATAQRLTRSARKIARDTVEVFDIGIQHAGHALMRQDGREVMLGPGDFAPHDSTRPWQLTFDGDFSQTVLQVPRAALLGRFGTTRGLTALRIERTSGVGGLLSAVVCELPSQLDTIPADARARLGENLLDPIITALLAEGNRGPAPSADVTLARAKLWTETHLAEKLSAECVASRRGGAARHLNRLFEREGTSLIRCVWQRRLARCHRALTDPAMRSFSITELAFAAGFNGLAHFSRAYRARYCRAAREARREFVGAGRGN